MIDLLSLPRRHNVNVVQVNNLKFHSGLPINSLPGWEHIPLNSKLPMLKCPGNQVIFTKNKIGQTFKSMKQEFDPSGRDSFPEYNPLHDSNLRTFYSNERNLKRLRENGEITQDNDVICNLKDFNEYRQQLHKSQLYYILHEMNRLEGEQRDRLLISNAEAITVRDHHNLSARQLSYEEILARKRKLDLAKHQKFLRLLQITEERLERIDSTIEMKKVLMEHKKMMNKMNMERHAEACNDLQRKHLISLKKLFQFKNDRFQKNLKLLNEKRRGKASNIQIASWEKRLAERIANEQRIQKLFEQAAEQRKIFIASHQRKYQEKWRKIQESIKYRARYRQIERAKALHLFKKKRPKAKMEEATPEEQSIMGTSLCSTFQQSIEKMVKNDLCEVLNLMVDMDSVNIPLNADDPLCKAAKFISRFIIDKFDKDLSCDKAAFAEVAERIEKFFDEAKSFVTFRASQIIASMRDTHVSRESSRDKSFRQQRSTGNSKIVSFRRMSSTIGLSSYEIHPFTDLRSTALRTPTPAGSLASVVVSREGFEKKRNTLDHLDRNAIIFIEHFVIKFKHNLIVGLGRRVFAAINAHCENKIMDVRKELLEIDRKFLVNQATKAILSYAKNSLNFETSLKICISALSSDIVWSLQKHLLKPERDPRGIVQPRQCCPCESHRMKLCLFCYNC